jgi:hypothetical protein
VLFALPPRGRSGRRYWRGYVEGAGIGVSANRWVSAGEAIWRVRIRGAKIGLCMCELLAGVHIVKVSGRDSVQGAKFIAIVKG